ncbi:hypothetical protein [Pontibacter rugosus]|uniref:Uncharacterized protein n=1 Tax=Pontibacter rugosus TaxID=1745966 RepID=A0ABW3SV89_9BACT
MPAQKDSNINDYAFDYLRSFYMQRFGLKKILIDKAEKTKHGYALDGLFSFNNQQEEVFIASLNTTHSAVIAQILTRYRKKGLSKIRYATFFLVLILTFCIGWNFTHWSIRFVLPVLLAATAFITHTLLEERHLKKKIASLLDDLKRAPADEQWIGLSLSSLTFRNNLLAQYFLATCKQRGIGVITVGKRAKVVMLQEPKTVTCRRGDFLSHYSAEVRIRKALLGDSYLRVA